MNGILTSVKISQTYKDHKSSVISDGFLLAFSNLLNKVAKLWFQNDLGKNRGSLCKAHCLIESLNSPPMSHR